MGRTSIEWTTGDDGTPGAVWNPVRGCSRVSEGCRNCYAERIAARFSQDGTWGHGFAEMRAGEPRWTGKVELIRKNLELPLKWKTPRRIFVNSTSDLFHENLSFRDIAEVFTVMTGECSAEAPPAHTYQILTKRPQRMLEFFEWLKKPQHIDCGDIELEALALFYSFNIPRRIWLGVSVENQETADERIPLLLQTPAIVRFLSCEPLLGALDLTAIKHSGIVVTDALRGIDSNVCGEIVGQRSSKVDWVITGGESGRGARPAEMAWFRSLRDQCYNAKVAFFMKQLGGESDKRASLEKLPGDLRIREFPV